jgi:hypothetical protein
MNCDELTKEGFRSVAAAVIEAVWPPMLAAELKKVN